MRRAVDVILVAGAAAVTLALAPAHASGQQIHVVDEASGAACGPCAFHATGTSRLLAHTIFGPIEVSSCQDELEGELHSAPNESGMIGHVTSYSNDHLAGGGTDCTRENCTAAGESEWALAEAAESGPGEVAMTLALCVQDEGGGTMHCEVPLTVTEQATPHGFTISTDTTCETSGGVQMELAALWTTEASTHDELAIVHGSPVEVVDEATSQPCNPCEIHVAGTWSHTAHTPSGPINVSSCADEAEVEIYADGTGHVTSYATNHGVGTDCLREGCASAGEAEWPLTDMREPAANELAVDVRFCLADESGGETHCTITFAMSESATPHVYDLVADDTCHLSGSEVEVGWSWRTEASSHDEIEVIHL